MPIDDEQVLTALRTVKDPELFKDMITLGRVKEFMVDDTTVRLRVDFGKTSGQVKQAIERVPSMSWRSSFSATERRLFRLSVVATYAPSAFSACASPLVQKMRSTAFGRCLYLMSQICTRRDVPVGLS